MAKLGFSAAKTKVEESNRSTAKYSYFKLEPNKDVKQVRFVTVDGPELSIMNYGEHYLTFKNGWSRPFSCPDYSNENEAKECKICLADKGPNLDITKDQFNPKFIMQLIERGGGEGGVDALKVYKFSPFLASTLIALYEKTGDLGDRDYNLAMIREPDEKGKEKVRYEVTPVTARASKLTAEDLEILESRAKLTDIEPVYDMNEVRRLAAMDASGGAKSNTPNPASMIGDFLSQVKNKVTPVEDDEEVVTPSRPAPATLAADPEDDEDANEFFKALAKHQGKK